MNAKDNINIKTLISKDILVCCDKDIRNILEKVNECIFEEVNEIRIRVNKPLMLNTAYDDFFVDSYGQKVVDCNRANIINENNIARTIELMSDNSLYAYQEELRSGFLTLRGGHRVGIVGKAVIDNNQIKTLKDISGLNIRIARQVKNCAKKVLPYIINKKNIYHTIIISPPNCGKTTMLRDLIRLISNGFCESGFNGLKVGLVDERSEIAACFKGIPQNDIGIRTDVLDSCPKPEGIMMITRSMSPHVIATDELGTNKDVEAAEYALNAGIKIITTAHASSIEEFSKKPGIGDLYKKGLFERILILSNKNGIGTVEDIIDGKLMIPLWRGNNVT